MLQFKFPKFFSSDLRDLLEHMIQKDLTRRYGNLVNGINDIKNHNWFHEVNWLAVLEKKVMPTRDQSTSKVKVALTSYNVLTTTC